MIRDITRSQNPNHFLMGLSGVGKDGTEERLRAYRIIDITDVCPETIYNRGQTVLKFGFFKRGDIVSIEDRQNPQDVGGMIAHFYPNERDALSLSQDPMLVDRAARFGCSALELAELVFAYLPQSLSQTA